LKKIFLLSVIAIALWQCVSPTSSAPADAPYQLVCRMMFWNVENLFDCYNDSLTDDEEFLPYGMRGWNYDRYRQKVSKMYKLIVAAGEWEPPDLIGLCEIENENVLYSLLRDTPFSYYNYRFVHFDSPDRRGIDVALLYNPSRVKIIDKRAIPVWLAASSDSRTRDILYARLVIETGDTLSIFVNHWPSKYGGAGYTGDLRENVSEILKKNIAEIFDTNRSEKIVVMGDFNDPPESSALNMLTGKVEQWTDAGHSIINMASDYKGSIPGSYKFEGAWQMIDQMLVSESIFSGEELFVNQASYRVFSPDFLLEKDEKYGGMKPNRTYAGYVYHGGYSDHLPVVLDLYGRR
jgi:predicted extracellular nuclease